MTAPAVSVVMPVFNGEGHVSAAIGSVLAQTHADLELVIVDDGSTDGTARLLSALADPRARISRQPNLGLAAARNTGIAAATGRVVAFLDADDVWEPEKLDAQLSLLAPGVLVYSDVRYLHERSGQVFAGYSAFDRFPDDPGRYSGDVYRALLARNFAHPSTVVLRREDLDAVGRFREDLRASEDWEYWLRCARTMRFIRVDRPLATITLRAGSLQTAATLMRETGRRVLDAEASWLSHRGRMESEDRGALGLGYFATRNMRRAGWHLLRAALSAPRKVLWWRWLGASILWPILRRERRSGEPTLPKGARG